MPQGSGSLNGRVGDRGMGVDVGARGALEVPGVARGNRQASDSGGVVSPTNLQTNVAHTWRLPTRRYVVATPYLIMNVV